MHSSIATFRTSLVTGGTGGIGRAVALHLARRGDRVLFAGRDQVRGEEMLHALHQANPGADHRFFVADLSLLADTARLVEQVQAATARLDALVCCAGILSTVPEWTAEGLERNFVLNYLTRYLLARRLLPLLRAADSGRVVLVSNAGMYPDTLVLDDLQHRGGKPGIAVAGRTQFANDLLAVELAARLTSTPVEVSCVYPGLVKTDVFRNARGLPWWVRAIASLAQRLFGRAPDAAAETAVFLAHSDEAVGISGGFFGPRRRARRIPDRARRPDRRAGLWTASEALIRAPLP